MVSPAPDFASFKGARVAKLFPGYGDQPFYGKVKKVDAKDDDPKAFKITYEDGDGEWVTYEELLTILVEEDRPKAQEGAKQDKKRKSKGGDGPGATDQGAGKGARPEEAAAAAAKDGPTAAPAAAKEGPGPIQKRFKQAQEHSEVKPSKPKDAGTASAPPAAAAAAVPPAGAAAPESSKAKPKEEAARARAKTPPVAAAAGPKGGSKGRGRVTPPPSPAPMDKDTVQGLIENMVAAAEPSERKQHPGLGAVRRLPYKGPGAAALPDSSVWVTAGGTAYLKLISRPTANEARGLGVDYGRETRLLLQEVEAQLEAAGSSKAGLLEVTVYLKDISEGLEAFTGEWNKWVNKKQIPVLTVVGGTSAVPDAGISLQARALLPS